MAGGLFTAMKVEIQWFTGQWVDVSSLVALEAGIKITQGRATEADDTSPGTCTFVLRNDDGRFTPNNPLSPYFPEVIENTPVRVSVVKGGSTYRRFTGFITALDPSFPDNDSFTGVVTVTCVDVLANLTRRLTDSEYTEQSRVGAYAANGTVWFDTFRFSGVARTGQSFPNLGSTISGTTLGTATMLIPTGSLTGSFNIVDTGNELGLDGALEFAPYPIKARGPILRVIPQGTPNTVSFWFKCPQATNPGASHYTLAQGYSPTAILWEIRLFTSSSTVTLGLYDPSVPVTGPMQALDGDGSNFHDINNINDEQWHKVTLSADPFPFITANMDDNDQEVNNNGIQLLNQTTRMYFGGSTFPGRERNTVFCGAYQIAGITITNQTNLMTVFPVQKGVGNEPQTFARQTATTTTATGRYVELCEMAPTILGATLRSIGTTNTSTAATSAALFSSGDVAGGVGANLPTVYQQSTAVTSVSNPNAATLSLAATATGTNTALVGPLTIGSENRTIARVHTEDSGNLGEAFNTLARSVGGAMWVNPQGYLALIFADAMRPLTPLTSVDVEADLEADGLTLRRAVDTVPTRVTVSGPVGDVIYTDTTAELLYARKEVTVTAGAAVPEDAYGIAGYYATRSRGLRVAVVKLDLVTSATDLYATLLNGALRPGVRLRATGLPVRVFGASQADVIVQGWEEDYDLGTAAITFDLTPADDPIEGTFDNAEYGRFSAGTSLCLGYAVTSATTGIVVAPADNTGGSFSVAAGDYPMDLDLFGERATSASAPGTLTRTNLVTNPSFETGTTSWGASPAGGTVGTVAASTSRACTGTQSALVTWGTGIAGNSGLQYNLAVTNGQTYSFSMYVYVPGGNPRVRIAELFGSGTSVTYTTQDTTGWEDGWVQLGMTFTANSTTTYFLGLRNVDATISGQVVFADCVLVENTTRGVGSYFDGSTNGGAWTGTANASTSTQAAQTFTVTRGVSPTTTAIAHVAAETVDVYHSMAFTY